MVVKINGVIRDILIKISLRQRKKTRQNKLVGETGSFSLLLWLRSPCSEQGSRLEFLSRGPNDILDWMSLSCGGFSHALQGCSATPVARLQLWQPKIPPEWPWGANHSWNRNSEGQKPPAGSHLPWLVCPLCLLPNCILHGEPSLRYNLRKLFIFVGISYTGALCALLLPTSTKTASRVRTRPIRNNEGRAGIQIGQL